MAGIKQVEGIWQRFGSMINTALIIGAFLGLFWKGGGWVERVDSDIRTNKAEIDRVERDQALKWAAHEEIHKQRLADAVRIEASTNERLKNLEKQANDDDRRLSGIEYRTTVLEQMTVNISAAIKEIQVDFNRQSSTIQVMKEILQRLEETINKGQRR